MLAGVAGRRALFRVLLGWCLFNLGHAGPSLNQSPEVRGTVAGHNAAAPITVQPDTAISRSARGQLVS